MSEDQNADAVNSIQQLRQTTQLAEETVKVLQVLDHLLRERGMNLDTRIVQQVQGFRQRIQGIEKAIVEEQTELGQLRALADMSARITEALDVDQVLEDAMDIVIALTRAERGYIILYDREDDSLVFRLSREDPNAQERDENGMPTVSRTVIEHVFLNREPLLADNAYQDKRFERGDSVTNFTLRSVVCVPLVFKDEILGVVYADNRLQAGIFSQRELNTLTAFANTAAVALANARFFGEIQASLADITHVKDLMDNVFASIGSGLIATNPDYVITTFNRAAEVILAFGPHDTIGKPLGGVLPKVSIDFDEHLQAIRETGEAQAIDAELNTSDPPRALTLKLTPLRDAEDITQGVAIVLDDVTEKVEREQQLRVMKTYLPPEMVDNIHTISSLDLAGESREITCVFAEVRSYYTMRDFRPREVMDILNLYLDIATRCVHDTRGVVDKYMGNEIMALYNTQLNPQQNHPWLAIEGALMMRDAFMRLYDELGIQPEPHFYRVGIHTGVATLGNVGSPSRRDFTAIGDTVNLAKRLQENAASGQVIISENALHALRNSSENASNPAYRFEELQPIQVKGRQQSTRIYEASRT
jgi:adenylate cyclase